MGNETWEGEVSDFSLEKVPYRSLDVHAVRAFKGGEASGGQRTGPGYRNSITSLILKAQH